MVNLKTIIKNLIKTEDDQKRHLSLNISRQEIESDQIPAAFDGFKIAFLSDLHGTWHPQLLSALKKEKTDLVLIGGDYFDGVYPAEEGLMLLNELSKTYFVAGVSGNHELYRKDWPELEKATSEMVCWLDNRAVVLDRNGSKLRICGFSDPGDLRKEQLVDIFEEFKNQVSTIPKSGLFTIALIHRPDLSLLADRKDFNLILSGHKHGGQWRFFGIGIAGPGLQGNVDLFPKYNAGLYQLNYSEMYVSRGLGDQMWIPRIFNNPDLVMITLRSSK